MKSLFITILIIIMVVFFGTWPLSILANIFGLLQKVLSWFSNILNIFGWNGLI